MRMGGRFESHAVDRGRRDGLSGKSQVTLPRRVSDCPRTHIPPFFSHTMTHASHHLSLALPSHLPAFHLLYFPTKRASPDFRRSQPQTFPLTFAVSVTRFGSEVRFTLLAGSLFFFGRLYHRTLPRPSSCHSILFVYLVALVWGLLTSPARDLPACDLRIGRGMCSTLPSRSFFESTCHLRTCVLPLFPLLPYL